ncbi:hypothetical protein E2C01_036844 [Portunus trituberculatus]|uniref:Uncharacterized protein n=1 Tax=Portunus trituberculatus TaxID=210409 RepID=A0A5B7FFG3_PORTR|nr:hypothetical protein [Portunus trituberculatus]
MTFTLGGVMRPAHDQSLHTVQQDRCRCSHEPYELLPLSTPPPPPPLPQILSRFLMQPHRLVRRVLFSNYCRVDTRPPPG